jgi:excisionase family DNA binding protein
MWITAVADSRDGTLSVMVRRFIPLSEVCEVLAISADQAYALVRTGDLPAIKVGGRGQWRVEVSELEAYIERMYAQTRDLVDETRDEADTRDAADTSETVDR